MKIKIKILITFLFLCIIKYTYATDIISNKPFVKNVLTMESLFPIFTRKQKTWNTGENIIVYIKPINSIEHSIFLSEWLGVSRYRYKKILNKQLYSGKSNGVKEVTSDEEMLIAITTTPYSIGYLFDGTLLYSYVNDNNENIIIIKYE